MDTLLVISLLVGAGTAWSQVQSPRSEERGRDRASDPITSEAMRSDAELTDVCFVNRKTGWAVGDRGVIWHTADGGKDWEIQPSGVSCRLESVSFISPEVGWAVGWTAHPYSQAGAGVLLWTRDGGRQWNEDRKLILPALKRVRFFGPRSGWAIGSPSAVFPSGILTTDSGGRSWNPVSGEAGRGWCTGDFLSMETAVVAGCGGRLARVRRGQIEAVQQQGFGLQNPARLKFSGPNLGWLVGEGGMVLQTDDQGATWRAPVNRIPDEVARQFDFAAVEARVHLLDRRHARHADLLFPGCRPAVVCRPHRPEPADSKPLVHRRPQWLGGRAIGHHPGDIGRRADLVTAAGRWNPCRGLGRVQRAAGYSPGFASATFR